MEWIDRLFNKHKFMRRFIMFWAAFHGSWSMWLVKYTLDNYPLLSDAKFIAICGLVGTNQLLMGVAIGLYQWDKALDKKLGV